MKRQIKLMGLMLMMGVLTTAHGQDEQEESEGKITVEITKEINGEKKTFKGEYENEEQMRADPNFQEFAGDEDFHFWFDRGDHDEDVFLHLDRFKEAGKSFFKFDFDNDDEYGSQFFFKHLDDDSSSIQFFNDWDSEVLEEKMKKLGIEMEALINRFDFGGDEKVFVITSKKVKVTDVEGDEFGKKGDVNEKEALELSDLTFFPNPSSNGKIRVKFNVPEEGELAIKVYNLDGKEVFQRYFERFGGTYSESIDLSGQQEGMYLLEISLGKKRLTKKILIN